ncbi:MAG: hypothetical protein JW850_06310 [Thermoflexales bacterium]|nr:hypothetical protein [Thermoflexales bacterium]
MNLPISNNTDIDLDDLLNQLKIIEQQSPSSALTYYAPSSDHTKFYNDLCQAYLAASPRQRAQIRDAVRGQKGVINNLLGYVYTSAERIRETKSQDWLRLGLAAASIRGDGPDYRDFLVALAELYVTAVEVGLEPRVEFMAIGGGVPANFHTYAVLRERLAAR